MTENQEKAGLRDLLKIRDFRYLWSGQIISNLGDSMTSLALLLLVNELTGSAAALATMMIALALPSLVFGMFAGVYVDRLDRKQVMIWSDLLRGLVVLGFVLVDTPEEIWILYLIGFIQATIGTFFNPARGALVPNIVPKNMLMSANSISEVSRIIFGLLGTGLAGFLVGVFDGYLVIFIADAATFLVSMVLISRIAYTSQLKTSEDMINLRKVYAELQAGLRLTFSNRILTGAILAMVVTMLGLGGVNVLLVPLLINELQVSETWFMALEFSQTASMVLSGGLVAALAARFKPTNILAFSLVGLGVGVALMAPVGNVWHVIVVLFLVGWFITPINASGQTMIQTAVPDEVRGRTGAANNALITTANLISMAAAGLLAEWITARGVFVVGGLLVVIAGGVAWFIFRGVEIEPPKPQAETLAAAQD